MQNISIFKRFCREERGTALVEYTLIAAFVMFTIVALAAGFHTSISGVTAVTDANLSAASQSLR